MPEVVYPTDAEDGTSRTWDQVFPIWKNDDQDTEWRTINGILEAIAIHNRMGSGTIEELKARMLQGNHEWYAERLKKLEGEPHSHKEEFPTSSPTQGGHTSFGCGKACEVPPDRQALVEERAKLFRMYGEVVFYIEEVFANLGGAYREFKHATP